MPEDPLSGRRVLIVEDEYFLADELDRALRSSGVVVLGPVPSVEAALDLLGRETVDVASVDVNLGGETAYPIADALRTCGVPFVFTTGYDRATLPERFADARRLEKPVEAKEVLRALGRLLGTAYPGPGRCKGPSWVVSGRSGDVCFGALPLRSGPAAFHPQRIFELGGDGRDTSLAVQRGACACSDARNRYRI